MNMILNTAVYLLVASYYVPEIVKSDLSNSTKVVVSFSLGVCAGFVVDKLKNL